MNRRPVRAYAFSMRTLFLMIALMSVGFGGAWWLGHLILPSQGVVPLITEIDRQSLPGHRFEIAYTFPHEGPVSYSIILGKPNMQVYGMLDDDNLNHNANGTITIASVANVVRDWATDAGVSTSGSNERSCHTARFAPVPDTTLDPKYFAKNDPCWSVYGKLDDQRTRVMVEVNMNTREFMLHIYKP